MVWALKVGCTAGVPGVLLDKDTFANLKSFHCFCLAGVKRFRAQRRVSLKTKKT